MFPSILAESLIHRFKFWENGEIHQGMRCGTGLYRHVATFSLLQSQQAYSLGTALCQQQQAVITRAKDGYTVWLLLQSAESRKQQAKPATLLVLQP